LTKTTAEIAARPAIRDFEPLSKNAYKVPMVKALLQRALLDAYRYSDLKKLSIPEIEDKR